MIASGEKKEEYREVKSYWIDRLTWHEYHKMKNLELMDALSHEGTFRRDFDAVCFKNGYSKNARSITVEFLGIHWGLPKNKKWIDAQSHLRGTWFFCIKLGKIISN